MEAHLLIHSHMGLLLRQKLHQLAAPDTGTSCIFTEELGPYAQNSW